MYISNVNIKNYRNIRNVNVDLQREAVIVGENNGGKSNFLRAITLPLTPDEAISFYTLSIRKTRALMKEETNFIVKYYDGRSLIIRREFEKYLENHPELKRR